ncbi:hypothetical protein AB6A40_010324, partial [Gnathostoma spinigerum]
LGEDEYYRKHPDNFKFDVTMYYAMLIVSVMVFCVIAICDVFIYRFFLFLCERDHYLTMHTLSLPSFSDVHRSRSLSTYCDSFRQILCVPRTNVITYPPECPPPYEPKIVRHRACQLRSEISATLGSASLVLPQYTDFRRHVYAEPPPYEEKYSSSSVHNK